MINCFSNINILLLSYINQLGFVSLGFEAGQHDDIRTIKNSVAFINLALQFSGALKLNSSKLKLYQMELKTQAASLNTIFEIVYLYRIQANDVFKMEDGFKSFQSIHAGKILAENNDRPVKSPFSGRLFMPLYQKQGSEGFFIIKAIPPFYLKLSKWLRRLKPERLLVILPGVSWANKNEGVLQVNLSIARFFAKSIFHLLGYRHKQIMRKHVFLYNRERVAKTAMYKKEPWYQ